MIRCDLTQLTLHGKPGLVTILSHLFLTSELWSAPVLQDVNLVEGDMLAADVGEASMSTVVALL